MYGGYGDDLLQGDDNLDSTAGTSDPLRNDIPDTRSTAPIFADIGFGGAGYDVIIVNTAVDRMYDWNGEFNSYFATFNPYGEPTVSRLISPTTVQYLYDVSKSDGADRTRPGAAARNGEPFGELGLVIQSDADWGAQQGSPRDPQPGGRPNKRDAISVGNVGVRTPGPAPSGATSLLAAGGALDGAGDIVSGALVTMMLNGDADTTKNTRAVLELGFTGAAALQRMRFSTDGGLTWTEWMDYGDFGEVDLMEGDGEKFVQVEVEDATGTVYSAWDSIVLDTKGPTVSLSGLADGAVLDVTASVRFVYTAVDENGVATATATLDAKSLASGSLIDAGMLLAGSHKIIVTAYDDAGNMVTTTITFVVRASAYGIISEVEQAIAQGLITANLRGALLAKLQAAQTAIDRGQTANAIAQLNQFISMVQNEAGKKVDAGLAGRLASWASDLIGRL
jgi:hypothetical protein